jgi:hypothetical protein
LSFGRVRPAQGGAGELLDNFRDRDARARARAARPVRHGVSRQSWPESTANLPDFPCGQ